MARSMKVKTGILEILGNRSCRKIGIYIFVVMEGMNETQLKTLQTASVRKIQKSRKDFLQEKFSSGDGVLQKKLSNCSWKYSRLQKTAEDVQKCYLKRGWVWKNRRDRRSIARDEKSAAVKEQEVQDLKKKNDSLTCKIRQIRAGKRDPGKKT